MLQFDLSKRWSVDICVSALEDHATGTTKDNEKNDKTLEESQLREDNE